VSGPVEDIFVRVVEEMERLNENIELLLINGIDIRTHTGFCTGPTRVDITRADANRIRAFVDKAINTGELQLEAPPVTYSLTEAGNDAIR
jgi:hypothetical protein